MCNELWCNTDMCSPFTPVTPLAKPHWEVYTSSCPSPVSALHGGRGSRHCCARQKFSSRDISGCLCHYAGESGCRSLHGKTESQPVSDLHNGPAVTLSLESPKSIQLCTAAGAAAGNWELLSRERKWEERRGVEGAGEVVAEPFKIQLEPAGLLARDLEPAGLLGSGGWIIHRTGWPEAAKGEGNE